MKTKYLFIAFTLVLSAVCFGQAAPPATPIDGGLSLLLVAGGGYGIKRIIDHRKNR